jgi:hypothetical protein
MRKLLLVAALAMAGLSLCLAEEFAGLSFEEELGTQAMQSIDGQMFRIFVPFNSKGMATVVTRERGDYCQFQVPVTTYAAARGSSKPMNDGREYRPVPLTSGSYPLGATKSMSDPAFGKGIHIETTVKTPYKDSGSFKANDFYVHETPYGNTWGCAGIQGSKEMAKVYDAYKTSTGTKEIVVSPAGSTGSKKQPMK